MLCSARMPARCRLHTPLNSLDLPSGPLRLYTTFQADMYVQRISLVEAQYLLRHAILDRVDSYQRDFAPSRRGSVPHRHAVFQHLESVGRPLIRPRRRVTVVAVTARARPAATGSHSCTAAGCPRLMTCLGSLGRHHVRRFLAMHPVAGALDASNARFLCGVPPLAQEGCHLPGLCLLALCRRDGPAHSCLHGHGLLVCGRRRSGGEGSGGRGEAAVVCDQSVDAHALDDAWVVWGLGSWKRWRPRWHQQGCGRGSAVGCRL